MRDSHPLELDCLQKVDSRAAHVLHKMEDTGLKDLTDEDQGVWLYFIMLFQWRNPDAVSVLDIEGSKHLNSPLKKASLTGFHATAKHIAAKAVSPSSETMRTI